MNCPYGTFLCVFDQFCVSIINVCNGKYECFDKTDELSCNNTQNVFICQNGDRINVLNVCDTIFDCTDKSDETFCNFIGKKKQMQ